MNDNRTVQGLVIHTNGVSEQRPVDTNLSSLQAIVGGFIEAVTLPDCHLYCNEEGKLTGLPFNQLASLFAWSLGWPRSDMLCGSVVFLGNGKAGEEAPLPQAVFDRFSEMVLDLKTGM